MVRGFHPTARWGYKLAPDAESLILRTEHTLMRTERAIDRSELAGAAPVALTEPLPRRSLVEILDY